MIALTIVIIAQKAFKIEEGLIVPIPARKIFHDESGLHA